MLVNLQVVFCICLFFATAAEAVFENHQEQKTLLPIEVKAKKGTLKSTEVSEGDVKTLEVDSKASASLTQVLQSSSSVFARESGTLGAPQIILRSQDPQETRYFLEGVSLTDAQFNSDAVANLPFRSVSRIDLYPDGVPAGLVSDGLGGAIDFHLFDHVPTNVGVKSGSFGYLELDGKSSLGSSESNVVVNVVRSDENFDYYDDGGTPLNTDLGTFKKRDHNRYFRAGIVPNFTLYRTKDVSFKYFGLNSYRDLEIPGPISLPMNGNLRGFYHLSALKSEFWLNPFLKNKSLVFARFNIENYRSENKTKNISSSTSNDSFERAFGLKNQLLWYRLFPIRLEQTIAANYEIYRITAVNPSRQTLLNERWDIPISLAAVIPASHWEFKPALVGQTFIYQGQNKKNYLLASPRLGVESSDFLSVKHLKLEGAVGMFYRAPSMMELNGTAFGISASPELLPERSYKFSTGIGFHSEFSAGWVSGLKLSYIYSLAFSKDLITYIQNSQNSQSATNVGQGVIQSHETNFDLNFAQNIFSNLSIVFLSAQNKSDLPYYYGKQIPNRPSIRLTEKFGYQSDSFGVSYQVQWVGERYWDLANKKKLSSIADHGISVNYEPRGWGLLSFDILNIFDATTANSVISGIQTIDSTTGYLGYPAPGRRIYLSWHYDV
jgi:outer membrane cobalamin receptor